MRHFSARYVTSSQGWPLATRVGGPLFLHVMSANTSTRSAASLRKTSLHPGIHSPTSRSSLPYVTGDNDDELLVEDVDSMKP